MRFRNNVIDKKVAEAIKDAELLFADFSSMMLELKEKNDFQFSSGSGIEVYRRITDCDKQLPVFLYKPRWRWSSAIGYSGKGAIHLNAYKLAQLSHASLVGLLCHEWLHGGPGFSHGNNYKTAHKVKFSVNYFVSENIGRWL